MTQKIVRIIIKVKTAKRLAKTTVVAAVSERQGQIAATRRAASQSNRLMRVLVIAVSSSRLGKIVNSPKKRLHLLTDNIIRY